MSRYDVFNGDADGLCALHQLRLIEPIESRLITGPKREIDLLARVPVDQAESVTVLDIAMEKNAAALCALLEAGVPVTYFDHHFPGEIPRHPGLSAYLDMRPEICTSLLVDAFLAGRARAWAVVGAFGDNLDHVARQVAESLGLDAPEIERLRELGICLNYNGYGLSIEDLHLAPDALYRCLQPYTNPLDFINEETAFARLCDGYADDMARARALRPEYEDAKHRLVILPDASWARRASGTYANELAWAAPEKAHAILTRLSTGGFLISVRAPVARPRGADQLCRRFPTGGGRAGAAGINHLPEADYDAFLEAFRTAFA